MWTRFKFMLDITKDTKSLGSTSEFGLCSSIQEYGSGHFETNLYMTYVSM